MNTNEELQAYWKLTDNGTHEAWPECVGSRGKNPEDGTPVWRYRYTNGNRARRINPEHALDLVRASAERWLVGEGWAFERQQERTCYTPCDYSIRFHTLPEALKHAVTNNN